MKTFSEFVELDESLANYNRHKIKVKVSKDGGEKHHVNMMVHATSESEAKGIARMKLHKQGYTTHSAIHQGYDYSHLKKEETEQIDEAVDPSEVADNPKAYDAKTVKAAYYHKKASEDDKKALARHLDAHHGPREWRKPVKEESESISEEVHRIAVTVSDPNHTMVTRRNEKQQKFIRIKHGGDKAEAIERAKRHYAKQGYKVHGAEHVGMIKEEQIDELSTDLLARYKEKASAAATAADKAGKYDVGHKRFKGILKATFKQFANDAKK